MVRRVFGTSGRDNFDFKKPGQALEISGLGGNDDVTVKGAKPVSIWGHGGNDDVFVVGSRDISIVAGGGNDDITVKGKATGALIEVWGGGGKDKITYTAKPNDPEMDYINAGKGPDKVKINKGDVVVELGKGNDTLKFNFETLANGKAAADVLDFKIGYDKLKIKGDGELQIQGWSNDGEPDVLMVGETIIRMKNGNDVLEAFGINAGEYGAGTLTANQVEKVFKNPDKYDFDLVA